MKTLTIRNTFHRTETSARLRPDGTISTRVARRVRSDLCGMDDCICGGTLGERSGNWYPHGHVHGIVDDDGDRYHVAAVNERDGLVHLDGGRDPISDLTDEDWEAIDAKRRELEDSHGRPR